MSRSQRHLGYRVAVASLAFIAGLTLLPHPEEVARAASTPVYCVVCGDLGSVDFLLNILLFVPLGLGLAIAGFSWRRIVVLAALTTFGIELLQMKMITGRDASLGDVLANTLGGGLGALLTIRWRQLVLPDAIGARRLSLTYTLALLWIWAGTAWALGPAYPQGTQWFGAWAPELGNFEQFTGTVLMVRAGDEPLLPGPALDQGRFEDAVTARPGIAFRAVLADPPQDLAPVGMIMDAWQRTVMLIGQNRDDLAFGLRMRASIVKLRNPLAVLRGGMAGEPGDTVDAAGALRDGALELTARNGARLTTIRLPLSASWGWSLITPWDPGYGDEVYALTASWIIGLVALLAYWSALAGGAAIAIPPLTSVVLLAVVPHFAGFPRTHWSEWVAAVAGITLGSIVAMTARRAIAQAEAAE